MSINSSNQSDKIKLIMQFLTTEAYLGLVLSKAAKAPDHRLLDIIKSKFSTEELEKRIIADYESFAMDASKGAEGIVRVIKVSDFSKLEDSDFLIKNWIYDKTTACVVLNLRRGSHASFCGSLYGLYKGVHEDDIFRFSNTCSFFLDEGLGFYKSSVSVKFAVISEKMKLNYQEKVLFKQYLPN